MTFVSRLIHFRAFTETLAGLAAQHIALASSKLVLLSTLSAFGLDHPTRQQAQKTPGRTPAFVTGGLVCYEATLQKKLLGYNE